MQHIPKCRHYKQNNIFPFKNNVIPQRLQKIKDNTIYKTLKWIRRSTVYMVLCLSAQVLSEQLPKVYQQNSASMTKDKTPGSKMMSVQQTGLHNCFNNKYA